MPGAGGLERRTSPERRYAAARAPARCLTESAGGALRERGHGGGDRPIPSRTRQLSPPSPKVLRIRSAGGRDAALAQGASAPERGRAQGGAARPLPRFQGALRPPSLFFTLNCKPAQAFCMLEGWISRLLTLLVSGHHFLFTDSPAICNRRLALCRGVFLYSVPAAARASPPGPRRAPRASVARRGRARRRSAGRIPPAAGR